MVKLWVQGVVRNGQVVLDPPLDLPDGTVLTVMDYDPEDDPNPKPSPKVKLNDEELAELYLFLDHKKDWSLWPAFEARMKEKYGPWLPHHYTPNAA